MAIFINGNERPLDIHSTYYGDEKNYYVILDNRTNKYVQVKRFIHDGEAVSKDRKVYASGSEDFITRELMMHILMDVMEIDPDRSGALSFIEQYTHALTEKTCKQFLDLAQWFTIVHYASTANTKNIYSIEQFERLYETKLVGKLNAHLRMRKQIREGLIKKHLKGNHVMSFPLERAPDKSYKLAMKHERTWLLLLQHTKEVKSWKTLNSVGVTLGSLHKLEIPSWLDSKTYFCFNESDVNLLRLGFSNREVETIEITDILKEIDNWKLI